MININDDIRNLEKKEVLLLRRVSYGKKTTLFFDREYNIIRNNKKMSSVGNIKEIEKYCQDNLPDIKYLVILDMDGQYIFSFEKNKLFEIDDNFQVIEVNER